MTFDEIEIPALMKHRASSAGETGAQWLSGLSALLADIERNWSLRLVAQISGGTEAIVLSASGTRGPAVLKLGLPDSIKTEALALQLADGRGYAKLLAYDDQRGALMLEPLGSKLADSGHSVRRQIEIICETLDAAWIDVDDPSGLTTGPEQAHAQGQFIQTHWDAFSLSCSRAVKERTLEYAAERERAFSSVGSVLVHGDAHAWNTLQKSADAASYKFVDPDALFAEPALDLAISLREWRDELVAGDTLAIGRKRCSLLAGLTGVDRDAIWQWGFIEHVACGLLDAQLSDLPAAEQHFAIATRWLAA